MQNHKNRFGIPSRKAQLVTAIAAILSAPLTITYVHAEEKKAPDGLHMEEITVTGRASGLALTKLDVSHALTTKTAADIEAQAPLSGTDFLKAVPGFWVESTGGESNGNVRARGIPLDGFAGLGLQEDGIAMQNDPGLGWLNADQVLRLDETVERVEAVRGGPSSIFASYAPGGIINVITKTGTDKPEGTVKFTVSDYGMRRADFFYGGPLAENWYIAVGGFYRTDDGIRNPQFTADDGGQIRFTLSRVLEKGRLDVSVRKLDDRNYFQQPIPLTRDGNSVKPVHGFDANYGTPTSSEFRGFTFKTPNGDVNTDLADGTHIDLTQFTLHFQYDLSDDWHFDNKFRLRDSSISRIGTFPNTPTQGSAFLADQFSGSNQAAVLAAFPTASSLAYRYTSTGAPFLPGQNGNGLVMSHTYALVDVPLREAINDMQLSRKFKLADQEHNLTFGFYTAHTKHDYDIILSSLLTDVKNHASRLDIVALNNAGNVVGRVTDNGVLRQGGYFDKQSEDVLDTAFYIDDDLQVTDKLRLDIGARREEVRFHSTREGAKDFNLGDPTTLADDAVSGGNGRYLNVDSKSKGFAWTVGANYSLTDSSAVFARYTSTYRLPDGADFDHPHDTPKNAKITEAEVGYKLLDDQFSLFATLFYTKFENLSFGSFAFNPATNSYDQITVYPGTSTKGIELEGNWTPTHWFDLATTVTAQKPEFENFSFTTLDSNGVPQSGSYNGNQPVRVPKVSARVRPTVTVLDGDLQLYVEAEYFSDRYNDAANTIKLPAYHDFNAGASYRVSDRMKVMFSAKNLTNELGLTEGNAWSGQLASTEGGKPVFLARPLFGRSYTMSLKYDF